MIMKLNICYIYPGPPKGEIKLAYRNQLIRIQQMYLILINIRDDRCLEMTNYYREEYFICIFTKVVLCSRTLPVRSTLLLKGEVHPISYHS